MFDTIQNAINEGDKIRLSITRTAEGLRVLVNFEGGEGAARTPFILSGTGDEIDADFQRQLTDFSEAQHGLKSTLDAAKAVLESAKAEAAKKAAEPKPKKQAAATTPPQKSEETPKPSKDEEVDPLSDLF